MTKPPFERHCFKDVQRGLRIEKESESVREFVFNFKRKKLELLYILQYTPLLTLHCTEENLDVAVMGHRSMMFRELKRISSLI